MNKILGVTILFGLVVLMLFGPSLSSTHVGDTPDNNTTQIDLGTPQVAEEQPETLNTTETKEVVASIGSIREIIRNAQNELRFFAKARLVTQEWFTAMAKLTAEDMPQIQSHTNVIENREWVPPHKQVILVFYQDDYYQEQRMVPQAQKLMDEGHYVYRIPARRTDLYHQYAVTQTPMWLVVRDKEVIYRHTKPPTFPAYEEQVDVPVNVQETQIYYTPSSMQKYVPSSCGIGGCR
jgi:hypothetical protein